MLSLLYILSFIFLFVETGSAILVGDFLEQGVAGKAFIFKSSFIVAEFMGPVFQEAFLYSSSLSFVYFIIIAWWCLYHTVYREFAQSCLRL